MAIIGPEVMDAILGSVLTFHVQLQTDTGEVSKSERGRLLEITARIKKITFPETSSQESLEATEKQHFLKFGTPSYPLKMVRSASQSLQYISPVVSKSGHAEPEAVTSHEKKLGLETKDKGGSHYFGLPRLQRTKHGQVTFRNIPLAFLLVDPHPDPQAGHLPEREIEKQSARPSTEQMEASTTSLAVRRSRSGVATEGWKSKVNESSPNITPPPPGEYVIAVREVTTPPFLGQLLPPVFKLLRVLPKKEIVMGSSKDPERSWQLKGEEIDGPQPSSLPPSPP